MSLDAVLMPALPQPPSGGIKQPSAAGPAASNLDQPGRSGDQDRSFVATLNHIADRNSCGRPPSAAHTDRTADPARLETEAAKPLKRPGVADQDPVQEQTAESESFPPAQVYAVGDLQSVIGMIDEHRLQMFPSEEGTLVLEAQSDSETASPLFFLGQPASLLNTRTLVGIEPAGQLQHRISGEEKRQYSLKQLAADIIGHRFAADPFGFSADTRFFDLRGGPAAAPAGEGSIAGRTEVSAARVDALVDYLLKLYENASPAKGQEAPATAADGQQAPVKVAAGCADENLVLNKITGSVQPSEADRTQAAKPALADKDGRGFWWAPKDANSETLSDPPPRRGTENSQTPGVKAGLQAGQHPGNSNFAAEGVSARPSVDSQSIKSPVFQHDLPPAGQGGAQVLQVDAEAKDNGFLASHNQLPEHLTRLEHAARSAEAAQRSLTFQTMDQIVQKAVLLKNDGQNAVQIDLKPDFLGHIRMQIVTENQHVGIRMVADSPFVKDMLNSNLSQLKSELQAQGLNVNELEVSVAHDSRADDDQHQKAAETRRARSPKNSRLSVEAAAAEQTGLSAGSADNIAASAIDYFA